ncbi:hypothetical protein GLAREA_12659 [Glarea lozoyensis ATCC 20868]|uniref:Uncharacterized protein n=1 Tax=Glarea lozoyensis (strain ATCC 20868 / MF5171) TaxID=1116229 RepID=S3DH63_GLAL2|nr:uncharacterized protein GLAREA_12659 [Glarea lozoyensis ATCC 20868]EPE31356.1 hypothetical protein GLAREA_12659 [Glarea lozoyensis ATCC 20868]
MTPSQTTTDINTLSHFLAHPQITSLDTCDPVDCIVICASSVLYQATTLFETLQSRADLTTTLVLCGGIGHSTKLIWEAVARHPIYSAIADQINGIPEARVLELIMKRFYPGIEGRVKVLVEDQSTNCGANAYECRKVLENAGAEMPKTCVVIQDPTMSLRTHASFVHTFRDLPNPPTFLSCPVFVPRVRNSDLGGEEVVFDVSGVESEELWEMDRFLELLVGEIPRLRDDEGGYGPRGRGFIGHVDVPGEVEGAWGRVRRVGGGDEGG